jgi:EAL domain-containing protein (putative c-di-GMP-specific phosphodiesterase class I)
VDNATQITHYLKKLNILIHMDDFGTGYSSLSHLAKLHVDTLKIDGSFVSNMDTRGENFEIVQMIISLAHGLRMEVIAEGVETLEQLKQLRSLGCEYVQGYFLSKPLAPSDVTSLLNSGKGKSILFNTAL